MAAGPAPVDASGLEDKIFTFAEGLLGLPELRRFVLAPFQGLSGVAWRLQSVEEPAVQFLIVNPVPFFPEYRPDVGEVDLAPLGLRAVTDGLVLVIATIPEDYRKMTVNLRAPLVFNPLRRLGRQVVLSDDRYAIQAPVFRAEVMVPGRA